MNLSHLNEPQREAVIHRGSPLLVLAGAGSGKTRVVTQRIGHLLHTKDATPSQILAVTFTNRAATEMRERVAKLVGAKAAEKITISTFHSFCASFLRAEIGALGYTNRFTIYDSSDQRTLLGRCFAEFSLNGEKFDVGNFQFRIGRAKNKGLTPDTYEPERHDKYDDRIPTLWNAYQEALRARNAVDFDDLLVLVGRLFDEHPKVLAKARDRYRHVLIDEYQDTNSIQFQIAKDLAAEHRNLCVVGDDDQSIYGWRGAEVSNILEFEQRFPDARIVTLDRNYRSTETILKASNAVIARNSQRLEKILWCEEGTGRPLDVVTAEDELDEAEFIVNRIKELRMRFQLDWRDFGVLYRSNIQSRPIEVMFRTGKIPYTVVGGTEFFDRKEVKDLAAYLRAIANPRDEVGLLRVVNVPRRGVGDKTLMRLNDAATARRTPLSKVIRSCGEIEMPESARAGIGEFVSLLDTTRATIREKGVARGVSALIERSGYLEEVERTSPSPAILEQRKQIVLEMVNAAESYERSEGGRGKSSLIGFLQHAALVNDHQRENAEKRHDNNQVRLMTLHSAKGLEFPVVFLVGVEEGLLPHSRSMVLDNDVLEERRLMYVGMTRARQHLILTTASLRSVRGRPKQSTDSRFLSEIPEELIRFQISDQGMMDEEHTFEASPGNS